MVNSRRKGSRAESEALNILKAAFGGNWERKSLGIPGPDLLTPDWFDYAVEVKDDSSIKMLHIFKPTKLLRKYWEQTDSQADALDRQPLLIAKIEGVWMCCPNWGTWGTLKDWCEIKKHLPKLAEV